MHPFVLGKEYARKDLLDFLGSEQAQSGVLWGKREPGCLICTSGGRHGKKAGYSDEELDDGSWWYFGQGQKGDQTLQNTANARLASQQQSVLLFSTREPSAKEIAIQGNYGKLFAFKGSFNVSGCEFFEPKDGPRRGDQLLRFRLIPADDGEIDLHDGSLPANLLFDLTKLQAHLKAFPRQISMGVINFREYRIRGALVRRYALIRAAGKCEGCLHPAPFVDINGEPFLEVHHLLRLADNGPDSSENVAALCPNCHKRAHYGFDRTEFGRRLREYVAAIETKLFSSHSI